MVLTPEEEQIICEFRRLTRFALDDVFVSLKDSITALTRSNLHRCLKRHGLNRLPPEEGVGLPVQKKKFKQHTSRACPRTTRASAARCPPASPSALPRCCAAPPCARPLGPAAAPVVPSPSPPLVRLPLPLSVARCCDSPPLFYAASIILAANIL